MCARLIIVPLCFLVPQCMPIPVYMCTNYNVTMCTSTTLRISTTIICTIVDTTHLSIIYIYMYIYGTVSSKITPLGSFSGFQIRPSFIKLLALNL